MENKFSKFINLQGKYLTSLLILLTLSIGTAWADPTGVSAGTYELSSSYKAGSNKRFKSMGAPGIYLHRVNNSSWSNDFGMKLKDNQNGVAFYISSGMDVSFRYYKNSNSKAETTTFSVYTISSSDYALFTGGTENSTNVELTLGTASATKTVELDASYKDYKVTDAIALTAGYYYIVGKDDTSNGTTYWTSLTLTSACSTSITTQPEGASLAIGDANPTLSVVATNVDSYAWKESSDGTSYDGSSTLGTSTSFTPTVNDAAQTKHYYCEVTSSCDGTTVVKSNIVTVTVAASITYYTVTLVPAGGTIADATGWTLNGGNYEKEVADGTELALPTFTKANRTFKTWRNAVPADVASPITVSGNVTLTAVWNATIENVIYSWESPAGTAIETGGTAITKAQDGTTADGNPNVNATLTNVTVDYKAIMLNGKISSNAWSGNYVEITTTDAIKAGDKVKVTACTTKGDASKKGSPRMYAGATPSATSVFNDGDSFNDIFADNTLNPNTKIWEVPSGVNTTTLTMTRGQSSTNCWVTKLQIVREVQVEEGNLLTVTFNSNGGSAVDEALLTSGQKVAKPADPTREGYRFVKWQKNSVDYDFDAAVTASFTLDAVWQQVWTVTFNANGGSEVAAAVVDNGQTVAQPADPTYGKHTFLGWFVGDTDDAYDFSAAVTSTLILKAHWQDPWIISFSDGEAAGASSLDVASITVKHNTSAKAEKPADPTWEGHDFNGWFYGDPATTFDWDANVTQGYALTAQWITPVAKYDVEYYDGETKIGTELQVRADQHPTAAGITTERPLYSFVGWFTSSELSGDPVALNTVTPVEGLKLYGKWTKLYALNADFEAYILANTSEKDDADKAEAYVKSLNYALSTKTNTTFDANNSSNNGAYAGLKIKNSGTVLSWNVAAGKVVEFKAGVMVANGSLAINGGAATTIDGGSTTAGNDNFKIHYFYSATEALYEFTTSNGSAEVIKAITMRDPFQVSFDENGGDAPIAASYGTPYVTLPSASKGTDSFLGWFDAATGGNKIGDAGAHYTPTANITLHAQWEAISTDNTLSDLKVGGVTVDGFSPAVHTYYVVLPYGTAVGDIPAISATANSAKAKQVAIEQAVWTGEPYNCYRAQANVQAEDESWGYYDVRFSFAPKDGVSIIKVATTGGTNKTVTGLYAGDGDVSLSSDTKMDKYKFIGFTLDGTTLQAGDRINVHTTIAANTEGSHIIFYDNMTDKNELYETGEIGGTGDNIFVINAAMVGATTAYVYRSNADNAHKWNGYVDFIEVLRPMNPVLTAITLDGVAADKDSESAFSATLPNGTNLASMTVVPTIVKNGEGGSAAPTAAWDWGANTYRVTDKDGDYTDYTITLTEAATPSAAPVITTQPQGANYLEGATIAALEIVATGSGTLSYQWYLGDDAIDGATSASYTPIVSEIGSYVYHCVVTNTEAGHPATSLVSSNATITIAENPAAIKLLDGEGNINTTDFITGVSKSTVNYGSVDHNCAIFGSTAQTVVGASGLNKYIIYNAKTTQTKIKFVLYNTQSGAVTMKLQKLVEGGTEIQEEVINVPSKEEYTTDYYTFNGSTNRTMYVCTQNTNVKVLQVKVVDDGTPVKQFGEVGYSINFNQGRLFCASAVNAVYDGFTYNAASNYAPLNNSGLQITKSKAYSFSVPAAATMTVTAANNAKYYITQTEDGTDNETAVAEASSFDLTAGTWYLRVDGSNLSVTNIAFSAPKCAEPAFNALANSDICSGDPYVALNGTATVADAGVPTYQWYKEDNTPIDGATSAEYTPTEDGKYYVIAINHLEGFSDNEKKSELVSVASVASTVINEAPKNVRKDSGEAATLTIDASGKNLHYAWKESDAIDGTYTDVAGAADAASLEVTVPDGVKYYKVVVSSDCGESVEAIAKVEKWVELTQVDVDATTEWDWVNAGDNIKLDDTSTPKKNEEGLMANIRKGDAVVTNDASFNSQALLFYGENVRAVDGGRAYASIGHISFTTTVPGVVIVEFSNNKKTSDNQPRRVSINDKQSASSLGTDDIKSFSAIVPAGEVVIMGVKDDGTGSNQYIRISKIEFVKVDYTRDVTPGRLGTICLPNGGKMYGAGLFEVAYFDPDAKKIFFDEIISGEMEAGMPYVFLPNQEVDLLAVAYNDATVASIAGNNNGLFGSFTQEELPTDGNHYILLNNQYCKVVEANTYVGANRAYLKIGVSGGVPTNAIAPAPGRRRISMGVTGEQVATGLDNLNANDKPMKVMIDGQLFIIRGEQMFDATGRLVK